MKTKLPEKRTRRTASVSTSVKVTQTDPSSGKKVEMDLKDETEHPPVENSIQELRHVGHVRVEGRYTKNLGNYESAQIGVAIEWPCRPNKKSLEKTYEFLVEHVEGKIQKEVEGLEAE